jgi:hypothetical protein
VSFVQAANPQRRQHGREPLLLDVDRLPPLQTEADASGVAEVATPQVPAGEQWHVTRIYVRSESSGATATVHVGEDSNPRTEVDGTSTGDGDSAEYAGEDGLVVPRGEQLRILWKNCVEGDRCTAQVQYRKMSFVDVQTQG